jgi:hypothetical protein
MADYWVGVRGDPTTEDLAALQSAGLDVSDLRNTSTGRYDAPAVIEWRTLRTFVRVSADDEDAAKAQVAEVLGLPAPDLVAYSAAVFG